MFFTLYVYVPLNQGTCIRGTVNGKQFICPLQCDFKQLILINSTLTENVQEKQYESLLDVLVQTCECLTDTCIPI